MTITKIFYLILASILFVSCHYSNLITFHFNGEVRGCGDFVTFRTTQDNTKAISVKVNKENLKITDNPQTFEIEENNSLEVYIEDFGKDDYKNRIGYCFDAIALGRSEPIHFPAIKGKVTIYTSESSDGYFYNATVVLENTTFQTSDNKLLKVEKVEMKDVKVGWLPG